MNKKYIFNTEAKAEEMILSLATANEDGTLPNFRQVRVTDTTKGIVVLGFQDKGEINEEGEYVITEEGTTFNVLDFEFINIEPFFAKTSQVQVFKTALSDHELELLTTDNVDYASYATMASFLNYNIS